MLSREDLLGMAKPRLHKLKLSGGEVYLRELVAADIAAVGEDVTAEEMIALSAVDKDGARLFTPDDVGALGNLPIGDANLIVAKINEINGADDAGN